MGVEDGASYLGLNPTSIPYPGGEIFFLYITALLRYNSHTIQLTLLKQTSVFFSIFTIMQPSPQSILEHFYHLEKKLHTL